MESLAYIKRWILDGLVDSNREVRAAAGSVIALIIFFHPLSTWPEFVERLIQLLDSNNPDHVHGALSTLSKIAEDSGHRLANSEAEINGQRPLAFFVPRVIHLFDAVEVKVRIDAIKTMNFLLWALDENQSHPPEILQSLGQFSDALFRRAATDDHAEVQRSVCQIMASLLDNAPETLMPQLDAVMEYMLQRIADEDEAIALEACEFWMLLSEMDDMREPLAVQLPKLIPLLMSRLVYGEMELMMLDDDDDDTTVPDREQDIKPWQKKNKDQEDSGEFDDEEDDDDDDDDELYGDWSLRKCAAATLDTLAASFGPAIAPMILPLITQQLQSEDWMLRESGILALGAIAEGCQQGVESSLPILIPYLIQNLQYPKAGIFYFML